MNEPEIFLSALEIEDPGERLAFLQSACDGDPNLLAKVQSLLTLNDRESQFLNTPAVIQIVADSDSHSAETFLTGRDFTRDEQFPKTEFLSRDTDAMKTNQDFDENPLGYLQNFLQPASRPDSKGQLAHYEILEVLGRGAFGTVLKAFDAKLERVVAIKTLTPEMAATSPARRRFLREARASAAIRHENVVAIYAVEEQPLPYLVMEYIPGKTLQQRLDDAGPLAVADVLRMGRQIAEGLAAAGAQGLIHRDIKPGNILLEAGVQERVKITDFGLARAADDASLTQSSVIAGTPLYMAPEQALGRKLDQRADLFSLGSVLYQMASGRPPFRAASTLAVLRRVTEDTPRPIKEIIPETPQWLCDIITKLHAKNPDERYQSAQEVADVLADCEAQLKVNSKLQDFSQIPRVPSTPRTGSWKWIAAAVIVLPLAMVLFPIVVYFTLSLGYSQNPQESLQAVAVENPGKCEQQPMALAGQLVKLRSFVPGRDPLPIPLRSEGEKVVTVDGDAWRIENNSNSGNFNVMIARIVEDVPQDGVLVFRAKVKVVAADKLTWGSLDFGGANHLFISWDQWPTALARYEVSDRDWVEKEIRHPVAECRKSEPPAIHLYAGLHANGVMWLKDVELLHQPAPQSKVRSGPGGMGMSQNLPPSKRQFASNEWIDIIPLIDPQLDRWNIKFTGTNEWRIENGELSSGYADDKPCKLLLPLDGDWLAYECEVEVTRRSGPGGFNLNLPTSSGDCPVVLGQPNAHGIYLGRRGGGVILNNDFDLATDQRITLRLQVHREKLQDQVTVAVNDVVMGTWQGDLTSIANSSNEGYPHARRMSLWVQAGRNELIFHRIRIRMLDGGTAETLRAIPNVP